MSETYQVMWPVPRLMDARCRHPSIRQIVDQVAAENGVDPAVLLRRFGRWKFIPIKHEAMWRAYETGRFSNAQIGRVFAGLDHTSVIHGRKKHQARIDAQRMAAE